MAINRWIGQGQAAVQVDTVVIGGTIEIGDIFNITIWGYDGTSHTISYTAADTTTGDVTAGLTTSWNASTNELVSAVTAGDADPNITLVSDTPGVAFKVTVETTEAGGGAADDQTMTVSTTQSNAGSMDWSTPGNWSQGKVPGTSPGDDVYIENWSGDILYGLDQSGASNAFNSLHIGRTFTGKIGHNGSGDLVGDYLQIKTAKAFIGEFFNPGTAAGSSLIKIDFGTTACDIIVYYMGNSTDEKPAFRMLADNASTNIKDIRTGKVGVAYGIGEESEIGDVLISYKSSPTSDASLIIGSGTTLANLTCLAGETYCRTGVSGTILSKAGTLTISGTGTVATLTVDGGSVIPASSGTITTLNMLGGICDLIQSAEARTITTLYLTAGTLQYDRDIVTITNKIEPPASAGRIQYRASKI